MPKYMPPKEDPGSTVVPAAAKSGITGGKRAFGRGSQLPLVAVAQPRPNGRD